MQFSLILFILSINCNPLLFIKFLLLLVSFNHTDSSSVKHLNPTLDYVFEGGTEGYACFRIPATVRTQEGLILAFAEGRKKGCSDTGDIDLVMKTSNDNGSTWSELVVLWDDSNNTCGNPSPVIDEVSGNIFLLSTWNLGEDHEREIIDQTSKDTRRIFVLTSTDQGHSWSAPKEITQNVKLDNWTWYATGPVSGIQLQHNSYKDRLVIPCDHIEANTKKYYSHIIYSDDHGATWQLGGTTPQDQVNECTIVELSDGKLMLNMRNYDREQKSRQISLSDDGGSTWSTLYHDTTLIEPICQGSLIRYGDISETPVRLFFSNPASTDARVNMTLRMSLDEGQSWSYQSVIHPGPSAYSNLLALPDEKLGCLFEGGQESPYEGIAWKIVEIGEW